jgi:hypothetical protein
VIIQESLITKIEKYIEKLKREQDLADFTFKVSKSKSTNSIYIQIYSYVDKEQIRLSYRFSDHFNSGVKTKIVTKSMSFDFIERKIQKMISEIKKIRLKKLMKKVN